MKLKAIPEDFAVDERLSVEPLQQGPWGLYRVVKRNMTTLALQRTLAQRLQLSTRQVVFPALKDKEALTTQHASLPAQAPPQIEGRGFHAQRLGFLPRPLSPTDLAGNRFTLVIRDLAADEAGQLIRALQRLGERGLPNYFDRQRFGSFAPGWGYIGKAILERDAAKALYGYIAVPFAGDPRPIRQFKRRAAHLWPDWEAIMAIAPRPSNWRSVLTYLIDHPEGYRKALNLIPARLLSLYLAAYQSAMWNRLVSDALRADVAGRGEVQWLGVADQKLCLPLARGAAWHTARLALPNHRAKYQAPFRDALAVILAEEGLAQGDLKARILKRAYLASNARRVWCLPGEMTVTFPQQDDVFAGRQQLTVAFDLEPGCYATLIVKAAAAFAAVESGDH